MYKIIFASVALALAASADTVYTWTGQVKAADNYYHFNETGNWQNGAVPQSGDDVILDFGTISAARNLKNDLVGLRIRGYRINADPSAAIVNIYGNKLTLVGTGGGTNDCDSIRAGGGPFYLHTDVEIVGDYYYKTTGGRTYLKGAVTSDSSASFHSHGATCNFDGDWSGFAGVRKMESGTPCFTSEAGAPAAVPLYMKAANRPAVRFEMGDKTGHSPIIFDEAVPSGYSFLTVFSSGGAWDGDITIPQGTLGKTLTVALNVNKTFSFAGAFLEASAVTLAVNLNAYSDGVIAFTGNKAFTPQALNAYGSGTVLLARPLTNPKTLVRIYGNATMRMGVANAFACGNEFRFGFSTYAAVGTLDLNGFDQTIKVLNTEGDAAGASDRTGFTITSATEATLSITNSARICAVVADKAIVRAVGCRLTTLPATVACSTGGFAASGNNGLIDFTGCDAVNSAARLHLSNGGKVVVPSGVTLAFSQIFVNGSALKSGTYSAEDLPDFIAAGGGSICAILSGPAIQGDTFTWKGGTDGNALATAANWEEGAPELVTGSSVLDFTSGTAQAVVSGTPSAYRLLFGSATPFSLEAATGGELALYNGGMDVASGETTISTPLTLGWTPQTWSIAAGAKLSISGPISALGAAMVADGPGTLELSGDNSAFDVPMTLTNGTHVVVSSDTGLGAGSQETTLFSPDDNVNSTSVGYLLFKGDRTCARPISLVGATGYINEPGKTVTFNGRFKAEPAGYSARTCAFNVVHDSTAVFAGGVDCGSVYRLFFNLDGGSEMVVRNVPIAGWTGTPSNAEIDLNCLSTKDNMGGMLRLDVAGNNWRTLRVMTATVKCGVDNALARDGWVLFGRNDWTPSLLAIRMQLDLNGHDQLTCGASTQWAFTEGQSTFNPERYAIVKSATPATLTMSPTYDYYSNENVDGKRTYYAALKFMGEAALHFAPPSETTTIATNFCLAYQVSDTKGALEVSAGRLSFVRGAGWGGSSNVVVNGTGTLRIAADSVATAFGENGAYTCLSLEDSGKIDIPSGSEVKVRWLRVDGRYLPRGKYGPAGSGAGVNTTYASHFAGGGVLNVRSAYPSNGTAMYLR